jgi:uncharacterized protein Veg
MPYCTVLTGAYFSARVVQDRPRRMNMKKSRYAVLHILTEKIYIQRKLDAHAGKTRSGPEA